jgi:hypothetical protein
MSIVPAARAVAPRAVRNCNPGNIREAAGGGIEWVGERTTDDDPAFEEFETPVLGFRALARTLLTYSRKHGLRTVAGIITRWAPPSENDTAAYIAFVSRLMQADPGQVLDMENRGTLIVLCSAIARKESGYRPGGADWFALEDIAAGVDLALKGA